MFTELYREEKEKEGDREKYAPVFITFSCLSKAPPPIVPIT